MWRPALGAALILLLANGAAAAVFSEGGGAKKADNYQAAEPDLEDHLKEKYLNWLARNEAQAAEEEAEREEQEKAMADEILREAQMEAVMAELAQLQQQYDEQQSMEEDEKEVAPREAEPFEEEKIAVAPEVAAKDEEPKQEEQIDESAESQPTDRAPTMQKKGQSEFVSFVDPEASKLIKSVPSMDKRTVEQVRMHEANKGGHLLFVAVGCVMSVGMVAALIGGLIRYRKNREEPDDQEYAPYAGTGPRNLKKAMKGEKGDETLAYKAQLHHYQQAKQKIICGEDNAGVAGDSDDETDEIDDENNFSVYECPGLAPTGDIEVHNPNFAADPRP